MAVGFYLDMTRCIGCRACQVACKDKNRLEVGTLYREVRSYTVGSFPRWTATATRSAATTARRPSA